MKRLTLSIVITLWTLLPAVVCALQVQTGSLFAMLINGGRNRLTNHERYWNDCAFLYRTLRQTYGVPKRNITVLMSDGGASERDMIRADGLGFMSSPADFDGDGEADVCMAATLSNVENAFGELAHRLTPDDRLLLFIVDHGGNDDSDGRPYLWLWGDERLYSSQLGSMLSMLKPGSMSILLGQCYSGAFISDLQAPGRIVITACSATEQSWACIARPYDEFVYHWTCALAGADEHAMPVNADSNGDGWVTMAEAFDYAHRHDQRPETPQYVSWPDNLGSEWALGSMIPQRVEQLPAVDGPDTKWSLLGIRQMPTRRGLYIERQNGKTRKMVR